ncbi:MAG TPA: 16S rRNA (guanine(527)-N(7))-methyltransferase RsmG [Caulobacteraceae bacterium]
MSAAPAPPRAIEVADFDSAAFATATGATPAQLADLERFRELLGEWNDRMNLVGPSALDAFWGRHAYDSAQLLPLAPAARTWADLGAGAGFPGLVLAILLKGRGGAKVHLVESTAKRCRFLDEVVGSLDLPASIHNARAESLSLTVDIVTARACAPLPRLLEFAWPYLRQGATGLFLKGQDVEAELVQATTSWGFKAELLPSLSDPSGRIVRVKGLRRVQR